MLLANDSGICMGLSSEFYEYFAVFFLAEHMTFDYFILLSHCIFARYSIRDQGQVNCSHQLKRESLFMSLHHIDYVTMPILNG